MLSPTLPLDKSVSSSMEVGYRGAKGVFFVYDVAAGAAVKQSIPTESYNPINLIKSCRTEIAWLWERKGSSSPLYAPADIIPYLGYWFAGIDGASFAARWYDLETHLKIAARTTVHLTSDPCAIVLHLSPFWLANDTRRSILTLFMRALVMNPNATLAQAIKLDPLASDVLPAINRFLDGYTKPTYDKLSRKEAHGNGMSASRCYTGFYSQFFGLSDGEIAASLVKEAV